LKFGSDPSVYAADFFDSCLDPRVNRFERVQQDQFGSDLPQRAFRAVIRGLLIGRLQLSAKRGAMAIEYSWNLGENLTPQKPNLAAS
jgi:hypothetical protein